MSFRYRDNLPLVIKDLQIEIGKGEKIGVIGRTGAGKSSIIKALLRINEPEAGCKYELFGQNGLEMDLKELRNRFCIIPQTPFLFPGSLRANLDIRSRHSEDKILEVLR